MRGANTSSSQGLTLPMRYIMRKRLRDPYYAPEITERRQVGDAEAAMNPHAAQDSSFSSGRGRDSEL
ncbi:hypothetical protein QBC35DRAFT_388034 [Podospora australis]|uniref:Uncharacterized protein n=1 Tax=Podospora australis TaxID=1536484 RepID=A0AAN6WQ21_9PEZI|nr:hypothetical protein QBC35DRAFT_388034 [Podospora australis]